MPTNLTTFLGSTFSGAQGAQGRQGSIGLQGVQGAAGTSSSFNVTATTANTTYYPVFVAGTGTQTPYIRNAATAFSFNASTGNLIATGNITAYSDIKLKDNIEVIPNALDKVQTLRGITYTRKDLKEDTKFTGVIAQEVEKVLPEAVLTSEEGTKSVAYGNIVGLLIEAIKEQQEQINKLTQEIDQLKNNI